MGLWKGTGNSNGLLNRIANPDPNGRGLINRIANPNSNPNGGLLDRLFGSFRKQQPNNPSQPQNFQDPNNNPPTGGASW